MRLTRELDGASSAATAPPPRTSFGRTTLTRFLGGSLALVALVAAGALWLALDAGRAALIHAGEVGRVARASEIAANVERDFATAPAAVAEVEGALAQGLVAASDEAALLRLLTFVLLSHPSLTEVTLTRAVLGGYDEQGQALLTSAERSQLSAFRDDAGLSRTRVRHAPFANGDDPTLHPTFEAAAHREARGQLLWSDLAYSELDRARPEPQRRKTLTAQKALFTRDGAGQERLLGVLRTGFTSATLANLASFATVATHLVFIADTHGRLVTTLPPSLAPGQRYATLDVDGRPDDDGDLRVQAPLLPAAVRNALSWARQHGTGNTRLFLDGEPWLLTLLALGEDQPEPWLVGVVVPERAYLGGLLAARARLGLLLGALGLLLVGVGGLATRTVARETQALVAESHALERFDFVARPRHELRFAELGRALAGLEQAKTALRALVRYVPVDLVRQLYDRGQEPKLGASLAELTLMFTDIADFTRHAETLPPGKLAEALGRYFATATAAVKAHQGTVDKYIGDALMVLWNAPTPTLDHARLACRAALACAEATRALATSAWWTSQGLPPWETRFGLHTGEVLVGHFGAPDRLAYTAIGDGVNLAARLEGLNKLYGTRILVSADVRERAGDEFLFRAIDRVAVKGKTEAVAIYELMGARPFAAEHEATARLYERALSLAWQRDFAGALQELAALAHDGPARVLAARCRTWLATPPPADWDGTFVATSK